MSISNFRAIWVLGPMEHCLSKGERETKLAAKTAFVVESVLLADKELDLADGIDDIDSHQCVSVLCID